MAYVKGSLRRISVYTKFGRNPMNIHGVITRVGRYTGMTVTRRYDGNKAILQLAITDTALFLKNRHTGINGYCDIIAGIQLQLHTYTY